MNYYGIYSRKTITKCLSSIGIISRFVASKSTDDMCNPDIYTRIVYWIKCLECNVEADIEKFDKINNILNINPNYIIFSSKISGTLDQLISYNNILERTDFEVATHLIGKDLINIFTKPIFNIKVDL